MNENRMIEWYSFEWYFDFRQELKIDIESGMKNDRNLYLQIYCKEENK